MNGMYITFNIFINGLLSLFICKCDSDTVNIYLSKQNVTGSTGDLTGTCNVTGLSRNEVVLSDTCTSSSVLAWVGAYATYSPWIEFKECGILKANVLPVQIDFTQKNFSEEPDIFKCFQHCENSNGVNYTHIGFQRYKCVCYFINDIEIVQCNSTAVTVCGENQNFICGDNDNVTVIYEIKRQVINSLNKTGECGIVNIDHNQTTFGSMECSTEAAILCFDSGTSTLHAYPDKTDKWEKAVRFCLKHDRLISSVQNVMNGRLPNVTEGTYWVSAVRGISYKSLHAFDNDFCVASIIENCTKIKPLVVSCDVKLPVTCRAGSADRLGYGTSTKKCDTTTTMENVSVLSQSLTQQNVIIIIATGSTGFICLVLVVIVLIFKRRSVKNKNYSGNPQHSKHDRKDSNTHVYNMTQGNDDDDLNPTRKEIHVHTTTQDKDYDDVDPNSMEMRVYTTTKDNDYDDVDPNRMEMRKRVYTTTQAKDYDDLDPSRKEMHVYTTTHEKDYDDLNPNRKEMHVYTMTQSKDYDDLDPNRKEMHVYTTTHEKDYDDLDPKRKGMHVYTTTQDKDYDDLDPNRKEMHVYTTTQSKDYDDLDPNRKEMHVYTTTHEKDYDDLDPNRKEMHVYTTTQGKDYDDLDPNRKEMHVYTTTQDNTSGYYTTIHADNT